MEIIGFAPDAFDNITSQEDMDIVLSLLLPLFEGTTLSKEEKLDFLFPTKVDAN